MKRGGKGKKKRITPASLTPSRPLDPLQRYSGPERRKPILIVQHAPHEHPAAIRRSLESQGVQTLCVHPYRGETYPSIHEIAGMISLGGPMGANDADEHPWIKSECELLKACVEEGYPTVGICLGGQMMAKALGGRVERHHTVELGWFPIEVNEAGQADPIVGAAGARPVVYQWHGDTFFPPKGSELLASSKTCPRQAYRYGERAYGFQFHPEADHQLVLEWLSLDGVEDDIDAVQSEFGKEAVQDAQAQRHHALKGEIGSLKITTAIGSLFRRRDGADGYDQKLRERLRGWLDEGTSLVVDFEGSHRRIAHLRGTIVSLLDIPAGRFMVFQEDNTLLWPLRLDDLLGIREAD